jgi:hypothetical protein
LPWLSGWTYRIPIIINNTANVNTLTNYQVSVVVDTASLISAGKMNSDGSDIRFTDNDGQTLLNYWIADGINTSSTTIWVKVPSIPANANKTIYLYYGNPSATSLSSIDNTFIFGQDFRTEQTYTNKWVDFGSPTVSFDSTNGITITKTSGVAGIRSTTTIDFSTIKRVIAEFKTTTSPSGTVWYDADNFICPTITTSDPYSEPNWINWAHQGDVVLLLRENINGGGGILQDVLASLNFHIHEVRFKSVNYLEWIVDGTSRYKSTWSVFPSITNAYIYLSVNAQSGSTKSIIQKYIAIGDFSYPDPTTSVEAEQTY